MPQNKTLNCQRREWFSTNLERLLQQRRLTIRALHKKTGIDYQRLRRWVAIGAAHVTHRTKDDLTTLATELGLDDADLFWSNPSSSMDSRFIEQFNQAYLLSKKLRVLENDGEEIISSMTTFIADVESKSQARSPSPVKWTGSKRRQTPQILKHFPKAIETYHEPFIGGGSVLLALLDSDIEVNEYRCSDENAPLIGIWQLVKDDPNDLIDSYGEMWSKLRSDGSEFYSSVRDEFDSDQDPRKFFFLMRTCWKGLVRFNRKGKFNAGFHTGRNGFSPKTLSSKMMEASEKLNAHDVEFEVMDYREVSASKSDFLYLDPPYESDDRNVTYRGEDFDHPALWGWMDMQPCRYILSFRGEVPSHLYDESFQTDARSVGISPLSSRKVSRKERLYVRDGGTILAWNEDGEREEGSEVADVVAPKTTSLAEFRRKQSDLKGEMKARSTLD